MIVRAVVNLNGKVMIAVSVMMTSSATPREIALHLSNQIQLHPGVQLLFACAMQTSMVKNVMFIVTSYLHAMEVASVQRMANLVSVLMAKWVRNVPVMRQTVQHPNLAREMGNV